MSITSKRALALLLSALALFSLTACGGGDAPAQGDDAGGSDVPQGVAVQVQTVAQRDIATENTVSGKVSADNARSIFIASAAKCTSVYFQAGAEVRAGDVLCRLDLGSTLSQQSAARISYNSAVQSYNDQQAVFTAQIALLEKTLENTKALYEIGAASQLEIDQAELQLKTAQATRNSTLAQLEAGIQNALSGLEQLDTALEDVDAAGNVIAPISGTLATMNAVENSYISTAMPLAVIDGPEQMKITVSVSEALVPKLAAGGQADVEIGAAGQSFTAEIRSVERAANMQTQLYTVTLTVPAEITGLLDGMFADVTFHTDTSENAVVVPAEAILTSGETQYVFVVENGTAKYAEVATGLTGSGVTEVLSGLTAGQQLVTVGQSYLTDGAAVRIVGGEG